MPMENQGFLLANNLKKHGMPLEEMREWSLLNPSNATLQKKK